jgi:hypothetical protein
MLLQAQLVHAESGRRVVLVSAHEGQRLLGSALGEAADAEQAEERALQRLLQRLGQAQKAPAPVVRSPAPEQSALELSAPEPTPPAPSAPPANATQPSEPPPSAPEPSAPEPSEPPPLDPEDWSSELSQLELQLQRIGWGRQEEGIYLQRAYGHASRSRITTYNDLAGYLRSVEGFAPGTDPASAPVPLRRRDLLSQCDQLLTQLGWEAARGRSFLAEHLGASSRSQLSDAQLLAFNMLLEGELIRDPADWHTPKED